MKRLLTGFLLLGLIVNTSSFSQADSVSLKETMQKLDNALLQKDEVVLNAILNQELCYGHSNGWIQSKKDVLNDFKTGKLVYNKIENNSMAILSISNKRATVKTGTNAEGVVNGTAFKLTLHVMQVWVRTKKGWQLVARQSAKIS
jgi:Domain of unknown function (DUF4440)